MGEVFLLWLVVAIIIIGVSIWLIRRVLRIDEIVENLEEQIKLLKKISEKRE